MAPDGRSGLLWSGTGKNKKFIGLVRVELCQKIDEGFLAVGKLEKTVG